MAKAPPWNIRDDAAAIRAYFARLEMPVKGMARAFDKLVREEAPGVRVGVKWAVPMYYLKGPICYVSAAKRHVTLGFLKGIDIDDATGLLEGTGKTPIRKAVIKAGDALPDDAIREWVRAAVALDPTWGED